MSKKKKAKRVFSVAPAILVLLVASVIAMAIQEGQNASVPYLIIAITALVCCAIGLAARVSMTTKKLDTELVVKGLCLVFLGLWLFLVVLMPGLANPRFVYNQPELVVALVPLGIIGFAGFIIGLVVMETDNRKGTILR